MPRSHSPAPESVGSVSTSVLMRARNGDHDAFRRIFSIYAGVVYHWCRKAGVREADAGQVSQEIFLAVSQGLNGFKRESPAHSFRGWLRVITRSRIADHFRNEPLDVATGGDDRWIKNRPSADADEDLDNESLEICMLYERAVELIESEFSSRDTQAFKLFVLEGLTAKEIADRLGMTANSVYIAKSRVLSRLRSEFNEIIDPLLD